jgi:hypothetical protein
MNPDLKVRDFVYSVAIAIVLIAVAGGAGAFVMSFKIRAAAAVLGALLCCLCAIVSRNPRLFCLYGLGFSLPFLFAKTFGRVINKGGGEVAFNIDVSDIFLFVLCLFLARDIWSKRRRWLLIPKASYFWLTIMFFGLVTAVIGPYRTTAAQEVSRMAKMLVLFIFLCQELNSPRRLVHWCSALTSGLFVNAIVGLIQAHYRLTLGLADLGEPSAAVTETLAATSLKGVEVWRPGAFLVHPNIFGIFLAVIIPLTIAGFLLRSGRMMRLWFLLSSILGMAALVATESRSAWISFSAALTLFLGLTLCHTKLRRRSTAAALVVVILVIGVIAAEHQTILRRILDSQAEALEFRGIFNEDARRMIADKPLWGFGLNSYALNLPLYSKYQYGSWPPPVHHIYYLWWAETGLIGLLLHLSMWGLLIWKSIENLRVRDETMFAINAACLAGMLAFILDGFVSFSLRITPTLKVFWALSAMIMAIHYWRSRWEAQSGVLITHAPRATASPAPLPLTAPLRS